MKKITYAWWCLGFTILVIVWGAVVRATGSGAGCGSHWPLCNGEILPMEPALQTFIEFSHRATSGIAFILVAVLAWRTTRNPNAHHLGKRAALFSFFFMVVEALIGMMLVKLELVADNQSTARAVMIGLHLGNTLFLVAAQAITAFFESFPNAELKEHQSKARQLWWISIASFFVVGTSGAITALGDTLFPVETLREGVLQDFDKDSHFLIKLRIFHPIFAAISGIVFIFLSSELKASRFAKGILHGTITNWVVGAVNVVLLAPAALQVIHLFVANALWICLVISGFDYRRKK